MTKKADIVVTYDTEEKTFNASIDGVKIHYIECAVGVNENYHYADLILGDEKQYKNGRMVGIRSLRVQYVDDWPELVIDGVTCSNAVTVEQKFTAASVAVTKVRVVLDIRYDEWIKQ